MKLFFVILFFISLNLASTYERISHLDINGEKFGILNFPEFQELKTSYAENGVENSQNTEEKIADKSTSNIIEKSDFEKPIYINNEERQKLQKKYKIPFNISMKKEIKGNYELTDAQESDLARYFQVSSSQEKVIIEVKDNIPEENLKKINPVIFILKFAPEPLRDDTSHTTLVVFLQDKPVEPPKKITFDEAEYKITIYPEYVGIIRRFQAKLDSDDGKPITKYSLLFESNQDDILKNLLKIDELSGKLEKTQSLKPGQYNFKISAKISTEIHTEAVVCLIVSHAVVCDSGKPKFPYAQVIRRFPEGKTGEVLEPMAKLDDKCVYKITSQEPQGDYFKLDEKTAGLKLLKEIKVDNIFKGVKGAKFVIKLSSNCDTKPVGDDKAKKDADQPLATDNCDIPYNPDEMILILYIDKFPASVFSTEKIVVEYPKDFEVISNYSVPLVTSVLSLINEPKNAIQYSIIEENCPFGIHPSKGEIYPLNLYTDDKDYTLTVLGKDTSKNVSTEGKLTVIIKFLAISELVEVIFVDKEINLDKLLLDYDSKLGMKIRPITRAVIPVTKEARRAHKVFDESKQARLLKTLCYAFDEKEENLLKGEIIRQKLISSPEVFTVVEVELKKNLPNGSSFALTSGIIAVILALGVLMTVMYLILIRRKNAPLIIMRRGNARNSVTPLEDDMEPPSRTRWIGPHANVYNSYEETDANAFRNPSYDRTRRISYSNTNGEIVIMENRTHTTSNDLLSSGVTSFKPNASNEDTLPQSISDAYYDLEFYPLPVTNSPSINVPVLDVTSLPPVSTERRRKKTNEDT